MAERQTPPSSEEVLSRRLSRTVLHAAERGRKPLFDKLTAANAERIAALMKERPVFFENKEGAEQRILLDPEIAKLLPADFFDNPTQWIEAQANIERHHEAEALPTGEIIGELWKKPYDVSRVKQFVLGEGDQQIEVVSKRIDPKEVEEVALARRAYEADIPTPKVLGEIVDHGNTYAWFEHIHGINVQAAHGKLGFESAFICSPDFIHDEEEYREHMQNRALEPYTGRLSDRAQQRLYELWKERRSDIKIKEGTIILIAYGRNSQQVQRDINERLRSAKFSSDEITTLLRFHGYATLDGYAEALPSRSGFITDPEKAVRAFEKVTNLMSSRARARVYSFANDWKGIIEEDIMGVDTYKEEKRLRELCAQHGVEHKDFADRNLVVEWDFENDKPLRRDGNPPRVFLVDWEQRDSYSPAHKE